MSNRNPAALLRAEGSEVYTDLLLATLPLLIISVFFYGMRCAALYAVGVVTANLCDRLVALLRSRPYDAFELSNESFAAMLVLLFPATISYYVVVVSVLAGVLLGKEAFGGYGAYVFHPTAVGYVVAAVSWPGQVCAYPQPLSKPAVWGDVASIATVASPFTALRSGSMPSLAMMDLLTGGYAGGLGVTALVVVLGAAAVLAARRRLRLWPALLYLLVCGVLFWLFPQGAVTEMQVRLQMTACSLAGNAIPFAAVFFLCDPITVPQNTVSKALYALLFAFITVLYSVHGFYDHGACFALLMCNSISGWIDRMGSGSASAAPTRTKGVTV